MTPSLSSNRRPTAPLYTPAERARRDATRWTLVQGVLAPVQFVVFAVSLGLVLRTLSTGEGETAASISVVATTSATPMLANGWRRLVCLPVRCGE